MHRLWLFFILLIFGCGSMVGQTASIHAVSPEYGGKTVRTTIAWNPFITIPEYSEQVLCDDKGSFDLLIPLKSPRVVQFETGNYQAYLFMEPGYHYEVELPEYAEAKWEERVSPYYEPVVLPLTVISRSSLTSNETVDGSGDLNHTIARFDSLFSIANRMVIMHRREGKALSVDSLIQDLEGQFPGVSMGFFPDYRRYRYGVLKLNEGQTGLADLSRDFLGPGVQEWHPGFIELFRAMFKDFIFYYSRTPEGRDLRNLINRSQDFRLARQVVLTHPAVWSDTLAEMVLLQELSELFYSKDYHKEAILIMLDSMACSPVTPDFGVYARQIKQKLSSLVSGHTPPDFTLEDLKGKSWSPEDLKGKYTYLFFGTSDHYGCMMEYPFLQSYTEKHAEYLNVVTVMVSEKQEKLKDFMQRNSYSFLVLHYDIQPGILDDYMIRAFPGAYLIDRDGKLLLSPAGLPSEGFEQQLFRIMRSRGEI